MLPVQDVCLAQTIWLTNYQRHFNQQNDWNAYYGNHIGQSSHVVTLKISCEDISELLSQLRIIYLLSSRKIDELWIIARILLQTTELFSERSCYSLCISDLFGCRRLLTNASSFPSWVSCHKSSFSIDLYIWLKLMHLTAKYSIFISSQASFWNGFTLTYSFYAVNVFMAACISCLRWQTLTNRDFTE